MQKTKAKIRWRVTTQLISTFVFTQSIVQSLYFLNPKFQACSHFLWPYSLVCVGLVQNSKDVLSCDMAHTRAIALQNQQTIFYVPSKSPDQPVHVPSINVWIENAKILNYRCKNKSTQYHFLERNKSWYTK